jgi:Putative Ig domain
MSCPTLSLNTLTFPDGYVGTHYTGGVTGAGGLAPYTFGSFTNQTWNGAGDFVTVIAGPDHQYNLKGDPIVPGTYNGTLDVTDANGCTTTVNTSVTFLCPTISVTPTEATYYLGVPYEVQLTASGGTAPYTFSEAVGTCGTLCCNGLADAGLTLSSTGLLSGTTSTGCADGTCTIKVTVSDFYECQTDVCITLSYAVCPTITLSPSSLSNGSINILYTEAISASDGTGPYLYTVTSGSTPAGLSLDTNTGSLSGYPTTAGTSTFTITATDSNNCTGTREYSIVIATSTDITIPPYRTHNPNLEDQYNRLQHFMCCLGSKGAALSTKLKLGLECTCDINTLELLVMYWNALECYDPTPTATNCLTQTQVDAMWDHISRICGICFSPYGSTYTQSVGSGLRIASGNNRRITTGGSYRAYNT